MLSVDSCRFVGNTALVGGALEITDQRGSCTLSNCSFIENTAVSQGGASYFRTSASPVMLSHCTWSANAAPLGAALYSTTNLVLSDCTVSGNMATSGAMFFTAFIPSQPLSTYIESVLCTANVGGCLAQTGGSLIVADSQFVNNSSPTGLGAAVQVSSGCSLQMINSSLNGNTALQGGALYALQSAVELSDCVLLANLAELSGGAAYIDTGAQLNVTGMSDSCVMSNNTALGGGGGAAFAKSLSTSELSFSSLCRLINNTALYGDTVATRAFSALLH
jgi:hypothetical protein